MKKMIILLVLLIFNTSFSQEDFEKHIQSIKSIYCLSEDKNGVFNANERAVDYALKYLKDDGVKTKFITNRKLLRKVDLKKCVDSSFMNFHDRKSNGDLINVEFYFKKFEKDKHTIREIEHANHIDGKIAFGSYYGIPSREIDSLSIKFNNKSLIIPKDAYSNLYNVTQCNGYLFYKPIEVYTSKNDKYIFIYLYGGNAADTYYVKLIFDNKKYISRIVADYFSLISWRAIKKDFLGF